MTDRMIPQMTKVGEEHGIKFSYGGRVGNTFDSHRLIWKAREEGGSELQDRVVESVFKAYFEEEKSLGEAEVLAMCAKRAGMEDYAAESVLEDRSYVGREEVEMEMASFRQKWDCRGVPLFVVDGKHPLSGAQSPESFLEVFDML
eukprot:CAMPEP_0113592304 /NCGR_PEP_ID=MMETSP0015_2-20120614/37759_1 /TAXON_ID=2838 /ORGANISM="Odontella" /LENGTH=144 /DNA_ID=CAMNT_0000498799 /DNA_START=319 /DNA_END=753 /DNA_ORIENTATION=+ /assembly_acc=CAM_ASM_000160